MATMAKVRSGHRLRQRVSFAVKSVILTYPCIYEKVYIPLVNQLTLKLSKMKKQLSTLTAGTKFYFGNNVNIVCEVTFNSGKTMRIRKVGEKTQTRYNKMPSICEGHSVTIC